MTNFLRNKKCALLCAIALAPMMASAQAPPPRSKPAPVTNVTADGSEAMFTTICALLAAGFEADVRADNWQPFRAQMRERLQHEEGPAVDALREFYQKHEIADAGEMLSRYIWFGLVSGPAPKFVPILRRDELPPEVLALEGFSEILSAYYTEQKIGKLWREVRPIYNEEIQRLHESVSQIVFLADGYLRQITNPSNPRTFTMVVEPLVGRITNVRNFGDHYTIVLSGSNEIPSDVIRHAYLHFLLDPLPLEYPHVVAVKKPLYELAAKAPRLATDLRDDFSSYMAECIVRAVELRLRRASPGERDVALDRDDADGYVLVRPLFQELANFEQSDPSMKIYFPQMLRAIDNATELKRIAGVKFAPGESAAKADDPTSQESVRLKPVIPTTVPNDQEIITALTEGERRIAEKNPRAAEAAFRKVLAKYPDQPRAWYGLGLVAMLEQDGTRAKQIFGRLTVGEHAAAKDPMVMAWSHIYLARIYGNEGQGDLAKTEYEAALRVEGGPEQARQAAQKGLAVSAGQKAAERP